MRGQITCAVTYVSTRKYCRNALIAATERASVAVVVLSDNVAHDTRIGIVLSDVRARNFIWEMAARHCRSIGSQLTEIDVPVALPLFCTGARSFHAGIGARDVVESCAIEAADA